MNGTRHPPSPACVQSEREKIMQNVVATCGGPLNGNLASVYLHQPVHIIMDNYFAGAAAGERLEEVEWVRWCW